jgi:uncharacterized protein (TIGR02996 family)
MNDEAALLDVIRARPEEDTPRLIYADWLDEHDQPERAEFIRAQIERAGLDKKNPRWSALLNREAELIVVAKRTWLRPFFLWADWSNLVIRRGFVNRAAVSTAALLPHLDSLRDLTALLALDLVDFQSGRLPLEDPAPPPPVPPPDPAPRSSWFTRTWDKVTGRQPAAPSARRRDPVALHGLCRVCLAERPRGLRVSAVIDKCPRPAGAGLALELLAPNVDALEPALGTGEWTVLAWAPDVPEEARLVVRLVRVLGERARTAPPEFFRQRIAARPVRGPAELAAWCPLDVPEVGPYWLRLRSGAAVDYCTGFSPPDDWLGGAAV